MENKQILLFTLAIAVTAGLKILIEFSARTHSKRGKLALNIGKCVLLLGIQMILLSVFSLYGGEPLGYRGCFSASCITAVIGIFVHFMQFLSDRKYPLSDEQKMRLSEL